MSENSNTRTNVTAGLAVLGFATDAASRIIGDALVGFVPEAASDHLMSARADLHQAKRAIEVASYNATSTVNWSEIPEPVEEARPTWLTEERLQRLEELSGVEPRLATGDDNCLLVNRAAMILDSGTIILTESGWGLLRTYALGGANR